MKHLRLNKLVFPRLFVGKIGFKDRLRVWIKACVFVGNLSVLVYGFFIEEINIQKGLKLGG